MTLDTHTVTLNTTLLGTKEMHWTFEPVAPPTGVPTTLVDVDAGVTAFRGERTWASTDGVLALEMYETGQLGLEPVDFRWKITGRSKDKRTVMGPYITEVTADMDLEDLVPGISGDWSPSAVEQAQAILDAIEVQVDQAADHVAAVEAAADTTDEMIADQIEDDESYTREALDEFTATLVASGASDAAALTARIASLPSTGGTIRLRRSPVGAAFTIGTTVTVDRPVRFVADRQGVKVTCSQPPFAIESDKVVIEGIEFESSVGALDILAKSPGAGTNYTGLRVKGCRFDGMALEVSARDRTDSTGATVASGSALIDDVQIVGNEFTAYLNNYTIEIAGVANTLIKDNWVHDTGLNSGAGDGIKVHSASTGTRIVDNTIENTTRDGIDIFDSSDNTVTGNVIRNPGELGIDAKWNVVDANITGRDIIANNRVYDSGSTSFGIDVHDALVVGNFAIDSGGAGFSASSSSDGSLVNTERVQFIGNHAIDCTGSGFTFPRGNGFVISGNVATGNGTNGIALGANTTKFTVMGNRCVNNTSTDISVNATGAPTHFLSGNTADDAGFNGSIVLPNNIPQYVYDSAGVLKEWLKLSSGGTLTVGSSGIATLTLPAGTRVVVSNEIRVDGALNHDGTTVGLFGVTPVTRPTAPTAANAGTVNSGDATTDTVVNNMRTRLGELETKLRALGAIT